MEYLRVKYKLTHSGCEHTEDHSLPVYNKVIISHCFSLSVWTSKQQGDSALDITVKSCPPRSLIKTGKGLILLERKRGNCQLLLGGWAWWWLMPVDSWLNFKCSCLGDRSAQTMPGLPDLMQDLVA